MNRTETQLERKLANCIAGISNKSKLANSLDRIHRNNAIKAAQSEAYWRSALMKSRR
jgi:hypothetical protein